MGNKTTGYQEEAGISSFELRQTWEDDVDLYYEHSQDFRSYDKLLIDLACLVCTSEISNFRFLHGHCLVALARSVLKTSVRYFTSTDTSLLVNK